MQDLQRTPILETVSKVGEKVKLNGWVRIVRSHGKVAFVDIRDYSRLVQIVFVIS